MSLGLKLNDNFKTKYKSMLNYILKEFAENTEDIAVEHLTANLPNYLTDFSDVFNSLSGVLADNKGEKIIGIAISAQKGIDLGTLMLAPEKAFTSKIVRHYYHR